MVEVKDTVRCLHRLSLFLKTVLSKPYFEDFSHDQNVYDVSVFSCVQKQQGVMTVLVAQRNMRNISFLTLRSPRMMTRMMTTTMRKRSAHPMMTNHPPVHQIPTHPLEGIPAAVGTLSWALLNLSPRAPVPTVARNPPQGEFGPADEPRLQAAEERCSLGEPGRLHQELSPQAVRAAPLAAACPLVWSCPHPSTASPQEPRCRRPADMSHCPLREDHLQSDPFPPFTLFPLAATRHPMLGPLPRHSGYSTEPLDTCHGRAQVQRVVVSSR